MFRVLNWILIALAGLAACVVLALMLWSLFYALPNAQLRREIIESEAQTMLLVGLETAIGEHQRAGFYTDDATAIFGEAKAFICDGSPCRHFLLAVQKNCESGPGWNISEASVQALHRQVKERSSEFAKRLEELALPCASRSEDIHLVAVGAIDKESEVKILSIDRRRQVEALKTGDAR